MKLFYEKYIKLGYIGKGKNALVYKVRHSKLGHVLAIKILNDYIESEECTAYQSFLNECRTLLAIGNGNHRNIVRIFGPHLIDNHAILEMDYEQGVTLDSYIKKNGYLSYEEIQTFLQDIVGALAYVHYDIYRFLMDPENDDLQLDPSDGGKYLITSQKEAELVKKYSISHNDLHSNNVMRRDYDGSFVLLDFGLAIQDGECIKCGGKGDGCPEYMAPEKFASNDVTTRSDVYSLGVLIYEVLTGRTPFKMEYDANGKATKLAEDKILNEHLHKNPSPILPLRKELFESLTPGAIYQRDYPEWLDKVVMKCLAKNPNDRYSDAKELLDDINWHIRHETQNSTHNDSSSSNSNERDSDFDNTPDTDNDIEVDDNPKPQNHKQKSNKKKLLFAVGGCIILLCSILFCIRELKHRENGKIALASQIYIPVKEYQLNVGDSIIIEAHVESPLPEDSIITWTPKEPGIVNVKGDTIIALKSGETFMNASIAWLTDDSVIKITVLNNNDDNTDDETTIKPTEDNLQTDGSISNPDSPQKVGSENTETPITPPNKDVTTGSKNIVSKNKKQISSIDLGYGTWYGTVKNGKPHGIGKLVFSSQHKVDRSAEIVANPGDYFEAVYENGQLISGSLFDNSGNKKKTIIP